MSERRGCVVIRLNRGTYRYQSQKDPRTELRMRMREITAVRVRYGCRKILVLLQRTVPRKRRVAVERRERIKPAGPNQVWSLDLVSDQLADGRRFPALTVCGCVHAGKPGHRGWTEPERGRRGADRAEILYQVK